jgi:hypothetical protein
MDLALNFYLESNQVIFIKKIKGYTIVEIRRHSSPIMDNIIEVWYYDSRKKIKGESAWITDNDLMSHISYYRTLGFTEMSIETNPNNRSKIK